MLNQGKYEPAFPQGAETGNMEFWRHGMSLRDFFAGLIMAALVVKYSGSGTDYYLPENLPAWAYATADEMLKERNWSPKDAEPKV